MAVTHGAGAKSWALLLALLVTSCTAATTETSRGPEVVRTSGSFRMEIPLTSSDVEKGETIPFPAVRVWPELPEVYRILGLPVDATDSSVRRIGTNGFTPRRIANEPVSRFLDCGRGLTAENNADTYRVEMTVETRVTDAPSADPAYAAIKSLITATASPLATKGNTVSCQSKGSLERRIVEVLMQRLGGQANR
jgi:hypothetical protein